jgi:hypothetical protein
MARSLRQLDVKFNPPSAQHPLRRQEIRQIEPPKCHGRTVTDGFSMKTQTATQSRQAVAYFMMKKMKQLQYSLVRYL